MGGGGGVPPSWGSPQQLDYSRAAHMTRSWTFVHTCDRWNSLLESRVSPLSGSCACHCVSCVLPGVVYVSAQRSKLSLAVLGVFSGHACFMCITRLPWISAVHVINRLGILLTKCNLSGENLTYDTHFHHEYTPRPRPPSHPFLNDAFAGIVSLALSKRWWKTVAGSF